MNIFAVAPAVIVPLIVFTFAGVMAITPMVLRSQERARMHETIRRLHENGETISPEMVAALQGGSDISGLMSGLRTPMADLRRGMILVAVALALVVLGFVIDAGSPHYTPVWPIIGGAAFPGLIGVAFLVMWRVKQAAGVES